MNENNYGTMLSVIVPYKNTDTDKFRKLCISIKDSVHYNYPKSIELIFVNDKSGTDRASELLSIIDDTFNNTEFIIKKVNVPNTNPGGILQGRLLGFEHSTGKYIWNIDSDDELPSKAIDKLLAYIREGKGDVIVWRLPENADRNESKYVVEHTIDYDTPTLLNRKQFQTAFFKTREISGYVHCKIVKRWVIEASLEDLKRCGYVNLGEDHIQVNRWFVDANTVLIIPERLYNYLDPDCSGKMSNTEPKFQLAHYDSVRHVKSIISEFFDEYSSKLDIKLSDYDKHRLMILVSIVRIPSKELSSELVHELIEEFGINRIIEYSKNNNDVFKSFIN